MVVRKGIQIEGMNTFILFYGGQHVVNRNHKMICFVLMFRKKKIGKDWNESFRYGIEIMEMKRTQFWSYKLVYLVELVPIDRHHQLVTFLVWAMYVQL